MAADNVIEVDGMQWRPKDDATATGADFMEARAFFQRIHREAHWNPWVRDEQAKECGAALTVVDQWERAEPSHRYLTRAEIDARSDEIDKRVRHELEHAERLRLSRVPSYDPQRTRTGSCCSN